MTCFSFVLLQEIIGFWGFSFFLVFKKGGKANKLTEGK